MSTNIEGERAVSAVAPRSRLFSRKQKATLAVGGGATAVLLLLFFGRATHEPAGGEQVVPLKFAVPQAMTPPPFPKAEAQRPPVPVPAPVPMQFTVSPQVPQVVPGIPQRASVQQQSSSPPKLLVLDDNAADRTQAAAAARLRGESADSDDSSDLAKALRPTMLEDASAYRHASPANHDRRRPLDCVRDGHRDR